MDVKAALEEMPEIGRTDDTGMWLQDNYYTIRQCLEEREKLMECIRELAEQLYWNDKTKVFLQKYADIIKLARETR